MFTVEIPTRCKEAPKNNVILAHSITMAGIYLHIPFCRKACHYCNFHFSTTLHNKAAMIAAISREALLRKSYLTEQVETVYFGGGTPSLLEENELVLLLDTVKDNYAVATGAEITAEANPDDINPEKLRLWKAAGINRLSIGIQSFHEADLQWMNRAHHAVQARQCIEEAKQAGFDNLSIDLIYGTPGLTDEGWAENIETALALGIPHLSCYALTVEPRTALAKKIETKQLPDVDPDTQARHFEMLVQRLGQAGYEQYEISNFALPGYHSRHNSSYWKGLPYLGLGPSAHSFNGKSRQWNVANNALYLSSIQNGVLPFEEELLTGLQQLNEYIMISLRTAEGISLEKIASVWGEEKKQLISKTAESYLASGKLLAENGYYRLSETGKFLADGIAADLFQL